MLVSAEQVQFFAVSYIRAVCCIHFEIFCRSHNERSACGQTCNI